MRIGIRAETRAGEARVGATPETVKKLVANGLHQVLVEAAAGVPASIPDEQFQAAGATVVASVKELYAQLAHEAWLVRRTTWLSTRYWCWVWARWAGWW